MLCPPQQPLSEALELSQHVHYDSIPMQLKVLYNLNLHRIKGSIEQ